MRRSPILTVTILTAALQAGCAAPPPPPPPTVVNLTLTAKPGNNPGPDGQAAPVTLRVYQLASAAAFGNADFFPLYSSDSATLGADLIKRDDALLAPGQTVRRTLMPRDDAHTIGIFAGYRDFGANRWRVSADIPAHKTIDVIVTAAPGGLTLQATTEAPPAKSGS